MMTLKLMIVVLTLGYLVKELLTIDKMYDKVYYLPSLLMLTGIAFISSFVVMWLMEQTPLIDWAGVVSTAVFVYLQVIFLRGIIRKDNRYFKKKKNGYKASKETH